MNKVSGTSQLRSLLQDYLQLMKVRLTLIVVFSSAMAYVWAANRLVDAMVIWLLSVGGFLVAGSANAFNQVMERHTDVLMKRTSARPIPGKRLTVRHAVLFAMLCAIVGSGLLFLINMPAGLLGLSAITCYCVVYTPLKKVTSLTVIPGAIAGSLPVLIGCAAATGSISPAAWLLFLVQFVWQFPHTWVIALLQEEDYSKAGIRMIPVAPYGRRSALLLLVSTFLIIPTLLLLYLYDLAGAGASSVLTLAGIAVTYFAYHHFTANNRKTAVRLMLGLLAYLPVALIVLVIEKLL